MKDSNAQIAGVVLLMTICHATTPILMQPLLIQLEL